MIKEFFELNGHKLQFAFRLTAIVFITIVLVIFGIGYAKSGELPDIELIVWILLGAGILFPLFITLLGTISGLYDLKIRRRNFSLRPFDKLSTLGFKEGYEYKQTKWTLTQLVIVGQFNDYPIIFDVDTKNSPTIIKGQVLTKLKKIDNSEWHRLNRLFGQYDAKFDWTGLTRKYDIKKLRINSIEDLKTDLQQITDLLKTENFEPDKAAAGNTRFVPAAGDVLA